MENVGQNGLDKSVKLGTIKLRLTPGHDRRTAFLSGLPHFHFWEGRPLESYVNFYKHHLGDYAKDTADLDALEHGIYRQLLDFCYATEKPLPNDWRILRRISGADRPAWQPALRRIVDRFFPLGEDGLRHNHRVEKELAAYDVMRHCNIEKINKRWNKEKANKNNETSIPTVDARYTNGNTSQNPESRIQNSKINCLSSNTPLPIDIPPTLDTLSGCENSRPTLVGQAREILEFLNLKTGRKFPATSPSGKPTANAELVIARLKDEWSLQQIKTVTARKCAQWLSSDKMSEHLTPGTLYRKSNFEKYIGECAPTNPLRINGGVHG